MLQSTPAQIFISYQQKKQQQVKALRDKLTGLGFTCWPDIEALNDVGTELCRQETEEGIKECQVFLCCLTDAYCQSVKCELVHTDSFCNQQICDGTDNVTLIGNYFCGFSGKQQFFLVTLLTLRH